MLGEGAHIAPAWLMGVVAARAWHRNTYERDTAKIKPANIEHRTYKSWRQQKQKSIHRT